MAGVILLSRSTVMHERFRNKWEKILNTTVAVGGMSDVAFRTVPPIGGPSCQRCPLPFLATWIKTKQETEARRRQPPQPKVSILGFRTSINSRLHNCMSYLPNDRSTDRHYTWRWSLRCVVVQSVRVPPWTDWIERLISFRSSNCVVDRLDVFLFGLVDDFGPIEFGDQTAMFQVQFIDEERVVATYELRMLAIDVEIYNSKHKIPKRVRIAVGVESKLINFHISPIREFARHVGSQFYLPPDRGDVPVKYPPECIWIKLYADIKRWR